MSIIYPAYIGKEKPTQWLLWNNTKKIDYFKHIEFPFPPSPLRTCMLYYVSLFTPLQERIVVIPVDFLDQKDTTDTYYRFYT